jgi:AAA domain
MSVFSRLRRNHGQPLTPEPLPGDMKCWTVLLANRTFTVAADELCWGYDGRFNEDGVWESGTVLAFNEDSYAYDPAALWVCCPPRAAELFSTKKGTHLMAKVTRSGNIKDESGLTVRKADIGRAKPFEWAWDQRILLSYINILMGEEGVGKGNLIAWVLSRITRGDLPGNLMSKPRKVAVIGDEDSFDHIWVPRLKVAGANLDLVEKIVAGEGKGVFDVRTDADALRKYITKERTAMVYIDQLLDNLGNTDNWRDKDVRDALAPLSRVAETTKVAILGAMHPNKRKGSFRDRLAGTSQFNAVSRSSLLVAPHPSEPGRIAVVLGKGNFASEHFAFEFRIEGQELKNGKHTIKTSRITDTRVTSLTRDELLEGKKDSRRRDDSKAGLARQLLSEMFADGKERRAGDVQNDLYAKHKLSAREVTRATTDLGFAKESRGFPAEWYWRAKGNSE